jgi:Protein of unknown function (DUF1566)
MKMNSFFLPACRAVARWIPGLCLGVACASFANTLEPSAQEPEAAVASDEGSSAAKSFALRPPPFPVSILNDTAQTNCYSDFSVLPCQPKGAPFSGQDGQIGSRRLFLWDNGHGTVTDFRTGLMWVKGQGPRVTWQEALARAPFVRVGGYNDWRVPNIKELYSLIQFDGVFGPSAAESKPFIDARLFEFAYITPTAQLRFFDNQLWSSTRYASTTMGGDETVFGVNFSDGRIKGYPVTFPDGRANTQYVRYVRGNPRYGANAFQDLGNGIVVDHATTLHWQKFDSGPTPIDWRTALSYCQQQTLGGYNDWRLPNAKELQSIVDYRRAPVVTGTPAIDPLFGYSSVESYYWTSTTLVEGPPQLQGNAAVYIAFGRALGYVSVPPGSPLRLLDVHGAGAQRGDLKVGDPAQFPLGRGPQGDDVRIRNYARCVRGGVI